jgi:hypothetical protein
MTEDLVICKFVFHGVPYEARDVEGRLAIYAQRLDQEEEPWELVSYPYIP